MRYYEGGGQPPQQGQPSPADIIAAYIQANGLGQKEAEQIYKSFSQMSPEDKQMFLQNIMQEMQETAQQQAPQQEEMQEQPMGAMPDGQQAMMVGGIPIFTRGYPGYKGESGYDPMRQEVDDLPVAPVAVPIPNPNPNINPERVNYTSERVERTIPKDPKGIQQFLIDNGYLSEKGNGKRDKDGRFIPDGIIGERTRRAIADYNRDSQIDINLPQVKKAVPKKGNIIYVNKPVGEAVVTAKRIIKQTPSPARESTDVRRNPLADTSDLRIVDNSPYIPKPLPAPVKGVPASTRQYSVTDGDSGMQNYKTPGKPKVAHQWKKTEMERVINQSINEANNFNSGSGNTTTDLKKVGTHFGREIFLNRKSGAILGRNPNNGKYYAPGVEVIEKYTKGK